ncbi:MAG TPA: hypothetical protein VMS77_09385 [Conexivisphaerales archaeon]|nr:hypothetical protein [Conexivisphaerales archaeon]
MSFMTKRIVRGAEPARGELEEVALVLGRVIEEQRLMSVSKTWDEMAAKIGEAQRHILLEQARQMIVFFNSVVTG